MPTTRSAATRRGAQQQSPSQDQEEDLNARMIRCVKSGDMGCIKTAIRDGADVNYRDRNGETALMHATYKGHVEILKELIKARANVNIENRFGATAIFIAAQYKQLEKVKELIKAGANVNHHDRNGTTVLITAVASNSVEIVRELLRAGADVNAEDDSEKTALIYACTSEKLEIVKELIKAGADVNAMDRYGIAIIDKTDNLNIIKELIEAGADVNVKDRNGHTLIYTYAHDGMYAHVKYLLSVPTLDMTIEYGGKTLIQLAAEKRFSKKINYLILESINKNLRIKGRNVSTLKQTLGRNTRLPENVISSISGYLTGRRGTMNNQYMSLKGNYIGGRRSNKTRKIGRTRLGMDRVCGEDISAIGHPDLYRAY